MRWTSYFYQLQLRSSWKLKSESFAHPIALPARGLLPSVPGTSTNCTKPLDSLAMLYAVRVVSMVELLFTSAAP